MKIVVINDFGFVNGGSTQVAIASAIGLARRGHAVTFIAAVGPIDSSLRDSGVEIECLEQFDILTDPNRLRAGVLGVWNSKAAERVRAVLTRLGSRDTVVHVHGWTKALSPSAVLAAASMGARVVCTLHDYFIACPNGGFYDYVAQRICKLVPLSGDCIARNCDKRSYSHKLWRVARHSVQNNVLQSPEHIDCFVAVSSFSRRILEPFLPAGSAVTVVSNPIELEPTAPVPVTNNHHFMMVGRLAPEKGARILAAAAAKASMSVTFVGDGPCRNEVLRQDSNATITGWMPFAEVARHLSRARALVFPSLWYENQPLVILEAAGRGIPAIVADTSAAAEMIVDGTTGLTFRSGDVGDLISKLRFLTNDGELARLGHAAYVRYWNEPPTVERHVMALEAVYGRVLSTSIRRAETGSGKSG